MHNEYERGIETAQREMCDDHWTPRTARDYMAQCEALGCAEGRDEFDRGYMAAVKAKAEEDSNE